MLVQVWLQNSHIWWLISLISWKWVAYILINQTAASMLKKVINVLYEQTVVEIQFYFVIDLNEIKVFEFIKKIRSMLTPWSISLTVKNNNIQNADISNWDIHLTWSLLFCCRVKRVKHVFFCRQSNIVLRKQRKRHSLLFAWHVFGCCTFSVFIVYMHAYSIY